MNHKQVPGAQDKRVLLALRQEARWRLVLVEENLQAKLQSHQSGAERGASFQLLILFPFVWLIFSIITMPPHKPWDFLFPNLNVSPN